MLGEIGGGLRRAGAFEIGGRGDDDAVHRAERLRRARRIGQRAHADPHVHGVADHVLEAIVEHDLDAQLRVRMGE